MAGFQVQGYFNFFSQHGTLGKHYELPDCNVKSKSHYRCKSCAITFRGFASERMESHLGTKMNIQSRTSGRFYSALQVSHDIYATPSTPQNPALQCLAPSPSKGVAVKKIKVSTPVSDKPGSEIFHCTDSSPLRHKLLPARISSGSH